MIDTILSTLAHGLRLLYLLIVVGHGKRHLRLAWVWLHLDDDALHRRALLRHLRIIGLAHGRILV